MWIEKYSLITDILEYEIILPSNKNGLKEILRLWQKEDFEMNVLLSIIFFILGFVLGVFTRNILIKVIQINNKIKQAEKIIAEEEKRRNFREKHDIEI